MRFSFMHSRQPGEEIKMILPQTYINAYLHIYIHTVYTHKHTYIPTYLPTYLPPYIHYLQIRHAALTYIHTNIQTVK